jgi:hypothetical protein
VNLQSSADKIPSELKKFFNNLQQNIKINIDVIPNREAFQLIINDRSRAAINEFKDFMQDIDIKVSLENDQCNYWGKLHGFIQ